MANAEDLAARLKAKSSELEVLIVEIQKHYERRVDAVVGVQVDDLTVAVNKIHDMFQWLQAGRIDIRKGLMCLQRVLYPDVFF